MLLRRVTTNVAPLALQGRHQSLRGSHTPVRSSVKYLKAWCRQLSIASSSDGSSQAFADLSNPSEEHRQLREMVRSFVENEVDPQALEHNREENFNVGVFKRLGDLGLLGVTVSPEYGGSGMDATAACIVHEELSAADPALCLSYLAHSMLFVNNLNQNGSHEQKSRFLSGTCEGTAIAGMCMSESGAGTDVLGMSTKAVASPDGSSFKIDGAKMWITNGTVDGISTGDAFLVYARTGPGRQDISMFLVEKGMPGFELGQKITGKCGMRASMTAELVFNGVEVGRDNLVGDENGATLCMMRNLEIERVTLAAMGLGIARRCIEIMNAYGKDRKAFGSPINSFGQVQRHIAESYAQYMAGKHYVYGVAANLDLSSVNNGLDADGTKLYCTTMAKEVADKAMQVLGGYGYCDEYQVERLWRDAKLLEIGGGTVEAHHKNMVRDLARNMVTLP
ncbi:unnamed protein product [Ascophyllum nodosum]